MRDLPSACLRSFRLELDVRFLYGEDVLPMPIQVFAARCLCSDRQEQRGQERRSAIVLAGQWIGQNCFGQ